MNADRYISNILNPVVALFLEAGQTPSSNKIMRQRFARRVLTCLDTQGIQLLSWAAQSPDLSFFVKIWSWVALKQADHPPPANTVVDVWHKFEVT